MSHHEQENISPGISEPNATPASEAAPETEGKAEPVALPAKYLWKLGLLWLSALASVYLVIFHDVKYGLVGSLATLVLSRMMGDPAAEPPSQDKTGQ